MLTGLNKDNVVSYLWGSTPRKMDINMEPLDFVKNTKANGQSTNLSKAILELVESKTYVDIIAVFTDMQLTEMNRYIKSRHKAVKSEVFQETLKEYRKINPDVKLIFWNLNGYGEATPLRLDGNTLELAGYSDNMLKIIPKMLSGNKNALVEDIEKLNF